MSSDVDALVEHKESSTMIKCIIFLFSCIYSCAAGANLLTQPLVGAHNEWPPYVFADGKGLIYDIVNTAFMNEGVKFSLKTAPFSRAMRMLENNEIDVIPALWWTKKRAQSILYSQPYFINELSIISRKDANLKYQNTQSLVNLLLCAVRGFGYHDYLQSIKGLTVVSLLDEDACLEHVKRGRVNVALVDKYAALFKMSKSGLSDDLTLLQPPLVTYSLHIGVSKNHPNAEQIITTFNSGLIKLQNTVEYNAILKRYNNKASLP